MIVFASPQSRPPRLTESCGEFCGLQFYHSPRAVEDRIPSLSPQNDNVLFAQSRNVLLTPSSWGGGRRTTTNDASRTGPPSGPEEGEEEADHPEAGSRRTGDNGAACETVTAGVEAPGRQGCGSRPTRTSVQPQAQCRYRTRGDGHSRAAGVSRVWAHTGCGVPGEETQDRREPGDRAAVDD